MEPEYKFDKTVIDIFNAIKNEKYAEGKNFHISVYDKNQLVAVLRPLTISSTADFPKNRDLVRLLSEWRDANNMWYPAIFKVTEEGTRRWLKERVIDEQDRLLFMVETPDGVPFGHMGFYRGEADNFIRGRADLVKGGMTCALKAMLEWASSELKIKELHLRVFSDNRPAIELYKRAGFREIGRIPMKKIVEADSVRWEEYREYAGIAERCFVVMQAKLS